MIRRFFNLKKPLLKEYTNLILYSIWILTLIFRHVVKNKEISHVIEKIGLITILLIAIINIFWVFQLLIKKRRKKYDYSKFA
jgi:hypothetical protein